MKAVTGSQMKKIDEAAIEILGIPGLELMENAGNAVYEEIMTALDDPTGSRVVLVCGAGNNGGDGYVIARYLNMAGVKVCLYSTVNPEGLTGDARANYLEAKTLPIKIIGLFEGIASDDGLAAFSEFSQDLTGAALVVDAILGTGVNREVKDIAKLTIDLINKSGKTVIAVDVPSGIGADDARVYGSAIKADITVALQAPKLGCLIYPGADYTGNLIVRAVGIPESLVNAMSAPLFITEKSDITAVLKKRSRNLHKGDFGKVLIIAGSSGMAGAGALCARAALRTGAGLVRLAVTEDCLAVMQMLVPEATCILRENCLAGIEAYDAVILGPGLGTDAAVKTLLLAVLNKYDGVLVLDADGLNAISDLSVLRHTKAKLILTPHPGEAGRLLGLGALEINAHRLESVQRLAQETDAAVVLKGAASLTALPDGSTWINNTGNPGMATAGSGDVLSGIIGALAAQGVNWDQAAQAGVYLHGMAGDIMVEQIGEYGLVASDLTVGAALAINAIVYKGGFHEK